MRHLALVAAILAIVPAHAQDSEGLPPQVAEMFPPGEDICYLARMDKPDRKPKQTLSEFYLYRSYSPNPALESVGLSRAEAIAFERQMNYTSANLDVVARFADTPFTYGQSVSCSFYDDAVRCGVDCDGGLFGARPDGQSVIASFSGETDGLSLNQSCGDPDGSGRERWLSGRDAGGEVRLERWPVAECMAADAEARPAFAADPMPLRERITVSGWRCLKRQYDAAHMKKHPRQTVTAMAVTLPDAAVTTRTEDGWPETSLAITVSLRLRDGSEHSHAATCTADQYQFRCGEDFRLRRRDGQSAWLVAGEFDDPGNPAVTVAGVTLGDDDRLFRLDAGTDGPCSLE